MSPNIELVRPLASGGMGQVWLAEHKSLDIQVAVKFMQRDVADDPVGVARFEQEAKFAARIKSPHVVEVLDYDVTEGGVPFIVMESLRGCDLETALPNGRSLSVGDTARVLVHVCKALTKAHAMGIIHRDIKAENVFVVQEDGEPLIKVLDFGVAKETLTARGISLSGTTVGTPSYMSPEHLFHPTEIDFRTDLWATAVLAYRCLTGVFPFEGESFASVCLSVSNGKFAAPSARNSVLPGALDAWFKKALHKNLDARFASAAEMSAAFLNELRKADLLPAWAGRSSGGATPAAITLSSARLPLHHVAPRRRAPRIGVMHIGAALAALLFFAFTSPSTSATVASLAGQATEQARLWAVDGGFYAPSLATAGDASSPTSEHRAEEVTWWPPPMPSALAERDRPRLEDAGDAVVARGDQVSKHAPAPPSATTEIDLATIRFGF